MSEARPPKPGDILKSLQLLRSDDPAKRQRGIDGLSDVTDDPRVVQVFEHLYQSDPDPAVREAVWRVLSRQGPSVPAPAPAESAPARSRPKSSAPGATFLLNQANRPLVRSTLRESLTPVQRGSRLLHALFMLALIAAGFLWGLAAPTWYDWFRLREEGVQAEAAITSLSTPVDSAADKPQTVAYLFPVTGDADDNDAPQYFGEQRISADLHRWLADADTPTLPVIYLPDDPSVSRLEIDSPDDTRRERLAIIAGGATVVALLIGVITWIARLPSRGVLRGRLLRGQVVAAQASPGKDGSQRLTVRFRFRSPGGRVLTSEATRILSGLSLVTPPPGTPVLIEYHSERRFRLL
ncbi:MAG: HEAT repeat domain-containing protein [Chloroflexi bacterium]|nr:HEAT repeat domain-containing protein [Chloroflexota bacterium]